MDVTAVLDPPLEDIPSKELEFLNKSENLENIVIDIVTEYC